MSSCKDNLFSHQHIDLEVSLDYEAGSICGVATIELQNIGDEPTQIVPLQLGRLMQAEAIRTKGDKELQWTQQIVTYIDLPKYQVNQLYIELSSPVQPDECVSVQVEYSGFLVGYTEVGWLYTRDYIDRDFTILREECLAFPCLGVPSMAKRMEAPRDEFTFSSRITAPVDLTVSTGVLEAEKIDQGEQTTWVFEGLAPVPFLNICIAPYQVVGDKTVRVYHFPADAEGAGRLLDGVNRAIELYTAWFGALEEMPNLHLIEIPERRGSQASLTGGIILTADSFQPGASMVGLYHELVHLWHPPDLDRPAPRWNEGLAMFLQSIAAEELDNAPAFDSLAPDIEAALLKDIQRDPRLRSIPPIDYGLEGMTDYSYSVGRLMFWAMYRRLGPYEWRNAMGKYFRTY